MGRDQSGETLGQDDQLGSYDLGLWQWDYWRKRHEPCGEVEVERLGTLQRKARGKEN